MTSDYQRSRRNKTFPLLVVEDNPDQQLLFKYSLQVSIPQSEPVFIATAEEALIYLTKCSTKQAVFPQLLLLDLYLPEIEMGWYLLKEVRARYPHIPVLVLSAHYDHDTVRQAYQLGAHSFINKPLDLQDWVSYFQNVRNYWLGTVTLPPM